MNCTVLNVAQMNAADRLTMAAGTPGSLLMQRAGEAVVRELVRRWTPRPVAVLCGPGNNGGDGFVAALRLAQSGWTVRVALLGDINGLRGDAQHHAQRWTGSVEPLTPQAIDDAELVVDSLFGSGLSRRLDSQVTDTLACATRRGIPIIAVDVPSGVMGDSGEDLGAAAAVCTVTFATKKPGHLLLPGRDLCGDIVVADISALFRRLCSIRCPIDTLEKHPGPVAGKVAATAGRRQNTAAATRCSTADTPSRARHGWRRAPRRASARASRPCGCRTRRLQFMLRRMTSIMVRPLSQDQDFAESARMIRGGRHFRSAPGQA